MEFTKKLLPKLSLKNPVDIYRMGWLGLAGTSVVYMLVILIRGGLGLDSSSAPQVRYTQSTQKSQMASQMAMRDQAYQRTQNRGPRDAGYQNSVGKPYYDTRQQAPVYRAAVKNEPRTNRSPEEKIRHIRSQARNNQARTTEARAKQAQSQKGRQLQKANSRHNAPRHQKSQNTQRKQAPQKRPANTARRQPQRSADANLARNYMNQASYMQKFTYDLNDPGYTKPVIKVVKARKINHDIFGVKLAKGKSVRAIRKEWKKLKTKYRKPLRNLEPLIIKEKTGDGYPIQLIVGPFSDSPSAVRFCASIYRRFNCNLKRYNGSPL